VKRFLLVRTILNLLSIVVTQKMWRCIESILFFVPSNIISYNKKLKRLKKSKNIFRWICVSAIIWGPLSGTFFLNLLLNIFIDETLSTTLLCINTVLLLISSVFAGISVTIYHGILLHENYLLLLFNTISVFAPQFG